jgi:predicted permease
MTRLRVLIARMRGFFAKGKQDRELNEELQAHLEMLVEEKRRQGMSKEQARQAAGLDLGGIAQTEEAYREARGLHFVETFLQDLRYAARMLRRSPGFTAVVIGSLALGIGANTAIFSAIDAVMLRMLPVEEPQQLVMLQWHANDWPDKYLGDLEGSGFGEKGEGFTSYSFAYPTYEQFRKENRVFSETLAFAANDDAVNVGIDGHAEATVVQGVSGNFFQGLGVEALLGRTLQPQDDQASAPPVAVISYKFWQQYLGGSSSVAGKTMAMNGQPITIVGVAPADFFGLEPGSAPGIFLPLAKYSAEQSHQDPANNGLTYLTDPKTWWAGVVGRLKPGISEKAAEAELRVVFDRTLPAVPAGAEVNKPVLQVAPIKQGLSSLRRQFSSSLLLLMMMVGAVLLIACGNVAALLLTRASARQREIAVRLSLGARRARLIRQLLTESVLLAACGGALGLVVAKWAGNVLVALLLSGRQVATLELQFDVRVLVFTAVVCIVSGILFGLAPALHATRVDLQSSLKQSPSAGVGRKLTAGKFLVAGQVALCLLLLVSAGLLLRTLQTLQGTNLGFNRQNVLLFTVRPGLNGYKGDQLDQFYPEMQRRMQQLPGVQSVSFADRNPIGQGSSSTSGSIPGYTPGGKQVDIYRHIVGPGYFDTLGIRLRLGRAVGLQDSRTAPLVVVVNQKFVDKYMHGDNPLGRHLELGSGKRLKRYEIVGVVDDVKYARVRQEVPPTTYFSHLQTPVPWNFMTFMVRSGEAGLPALTSAVRREALAQDKNIPLVEMKTETQVVSQVLFLDRTFAALSSAFGFLALLLACVGLYGTMAYAVSRRTSEIGLRMALGAGRSSILSMVLRETAIIVLAGIAVGLPGAWAVTGLLKTRLFGLSPYDPWSIALAIAATLVVTAIAGYVPARRASRVDPMAALRYE